MTTILSVSTLLFIFIILFLNYFLKYNNLRKEVSVIILKLKSPLRDGYYKQSLSAKNDTIKFESIIYIKEIDRYTNGESKIIIDKIDYGINDNKVSHSSIDEFINGYFKSVVKTSDITWLESEQNIKAQRKEKLERLKEITK